MHFTYMIIQMNHDSIYYDKLSLILQLSLIILNIKFS